MASKKRTNAKANGRKANGNRGNGRGAARVRWLRTSVEQMRRIADTADCIYTEADQVFVEMSGAEDVTAPDPLLDMCCLGGEGMMRIVDEARRAISIVEREQDLLEARLRGEWREEWARPAAAEGPDHDPDWQIMRELKRLDPGAYELTMAAILRIAGASKVSSAIGAIVAAESPVDGSAILAELDAQVEAHRAESSMRAASAQ